VHGLIPISSKDEFLVRLIDTPEFQRLHRIRQLGVGSLTFPGADHTRFCHSLGVYHIANRIIGTLKARYRDGSEAGLLEKYAQTIKAAALLHDIGHGPFSHLVERAFENQKDHEERTKEIISDSSGRVGLILKETGQDQHEITSVIGKSFRYLFLQDIVSSQLDADRMDYLSRDSHFAGVKYGAFDLEWILNSICLGSYDGNGTPERCRLCLDERRGLQAAEQLILARQHMSLQVYYHKSTRRWEAVFLCLVREAVRLAALGKLPKGTSKIVAKFFRKKGRLTYEEFLAVDEPLLLTAFSAWRSAKEEHCRWLSQLATGFLERRKVLDRIDFDRKLDSTQEAILRNMLSDELKDTHDSHWELDSGNFTPYKAPDPDQRDLDHEGYREGVLASSILLSNGTPTTQAIPVSEASEIFRLLAKQQFKMQRLYCDPALKIHAEKIVKAASAA